MSPGLSQVYQKAKQKGKELYGKGKERWKEASSLAKKDKSSRLREDGPVIAITLAFIFDLLEIPAEIIQLIPYVGVVGTILSFFLDLVAFLSLTIVASIETQRFIVPLKGWSFLLEPLPIVGSLWFGWTIGMKNAMKKYA